MPALVAVAIDALAVGGRVDDADQGEQLQPGDQREQVGAGVEGRRVEVLARGGDHPQALLP